MATDIQGSLAPEVATLQSELGELKDEVKTLQRSCVIAQEQVAELTRELPNAERVLHLVKESRKEWKARSERQHSTVVFVYHLWTFAVQVAAVITCFLFLYNRASQSATIWGLALVTITFLTSTTILLRHLQRAMDKSQ